MMCTMTREWERRLTAVRAERKKRRLSQVELADAAGVTESTIQNLEGQRTYKRKPGTLDVVWAALQTIDDHAGTEEAAQPAAPGRRDAVPLRVRHELTEGDVVDTDVIDLSRGGMKMVVLVTRDRDGAPVDEEAMREDFAEWTRVQRALRKIADGQADDAVG